MYNVCLQVFEPQHQQQLERVHVGSSQDAARASGGRAGSMELSRMEGAAGSHPAGSRPNGRGPASGRSLELARSAGSMQRAGSRRGPVSFKAIEEEKQEKPALQEQVSLHCSPLCTRWA